MFKRIAAVQPLDGYEIIVWFADGEARVFNAQSLMDSHEEFDALHDETFFSSVTLAAEGYGISWGENLDLGCKEIYENSKAIDVVATESNRVISEVVESRHKCGMSKAKLAMAAGVKQPVVARLETRVNAPRLDTLLKLLTPLGKTLQIVDPADEFVQQ